MKFKYEPDNRIITILTEDDAEVIQITPETIRDLSHVNALPVVPELANMIRMEKPYVNMPELVRVLEELVAIYGK